MKKAIAETLVTFLIVMGLAACEQESTTSPSTMSAQTTQPASHAEGAKQAAAAGADAIAINTSCPVSGEKVDPRGSKVTYNGKTYGFCCDDCVEAFNANPAKYADAR